MPAESSDELTILIEKQSHKKDANIEVLVRKYKEFYTDRPIFRLVQDISSRSRIYQNLLEEIKGIVPPAPSAPDPKLSADEIATGLKKKYEDFGLIPTGNLPNPTARSIARYILDKLASFARAILDIIAKYASQIAEELRVSPEVTITFQVGAGWSPDVTVGIERKGSWGHAEP